MPKPPRRSTRAAAALLLAGCASGPAGLDAQAPVDREPPGLVVLLVVDQLRADLLDRYDTLFTGGFRRLAREGRVYANGTHDHLVTETAPGHASLATGTHPSRHGVVSNQWYEIREGQWVIVENVIDESHPLVGAERYAGASPSVMLRDGLGDWLQAADDDSRVVSISGKPRGAVLLGGRGDASAYWFETVLGGFTTSTFYGDRVPGWVREFNEEVMPGFLADSVWESTVPAGAAGLSRPDTASYEGDGVHTAFPHTFAGARERYPEIDFWTWFAITPELDRATLQLARRAIEEEDLGEDGTPDLLALSLSQTDRVGHDFGPLSREQLDNLLRLDRELGRFFDFLDESVGQGRWVLGFSSDHGAQDAPEWEVEQGISGAIRLDRDSLQSLQRVLTETARRVGSTDPAELAQPLADRIVTLPWMARAWTLRTLEEEGEPADSFEVLARNAHHPGRPTGVLGRLGVLFMLREHVLPFGYPDGGSTHQSGYHHDRHVPFVLMGAGVAPGVDRTRVSTTDMAPTLAVLAGIRPPGDLDGKALDPGGG